VDLDLFLIILVFSVSVPLILMNIMERVILPAQLACLEMMLTGCVKIANWDAMNVLMQQPALYAIPPLIP